jgi:hypothetical protein
LGRSLREYDTAKAPGKIKKPATDIPWLAYAAADGPRQRDAVRSQCVGAE